MITTKSNRNNPVRMDRVVKVFDVSKKELIMSFETLSEASRFTGVDKSHIRYYIKSKGHSIANKLNKVICFR